ncbi:MAG: hypothetical protein IKH33_03270 [Bacteroidales bacterium]|nr:hypothetical protein [Bacteroidales bacterium]
MKNRTLAALLLLAFMPMLLVSCTEEVKPVEVNDSLLIGKWQKETNMQEYWRYDADSTGETWDESEDVQEGEGIKFNWSTEEDQLRLDFYGEMGQHVYYDYTVVTQTESRLEWKDIYGNKQVFLKKLS